MAYQLQGRLLELCTCGTYCPCQATGEPGNGTCEAVNAWHIDTGVIDGTDVSGLTLVALSHVHGYVLQGRPVTFYLDDSASEAQQAALLAVWTGKLGGPIADVARLLGEVTGIERAPISFTVDGGHGAVQVAQTLNAQLMPAQELEGQPETAQHTLSHAANSTSHAANGASQSRYGDVCTTIAGSQTSAQTAAEFQVTAPAYGFAIDLRNPKVIQGRFSFQS